MAKNQESTVLEPLSRLVSVMKDVFAGDLASVILYGSAARGAYRRGVSDLNILILLEKSYPRRIFLFGKKAGRLIRRFRITPLIMSVPEFQGSADVFPMEYADMAEARRVLHGPDPAFPALTRTNLRHQLEERLRGAVNDLRQMLIAAEGRERALGRFLRNWSGVPNAIFRGLAGLRGAAAARDPGETLVFVAREYGIPTDAFTDLGRLRGGESIPPGDLAGRLLEALKALAAAVDAMPDGEDR